MRKVTFELDGQPYEAELLRSRNKTARVGWLVADVPPALAPRVERTTRPGWRSMRVPIAGPNAVTLREVPRPRRAARPARRAVGVQTAELAKRLGLFLRSQRWDTDLQIICSHRGLYQDEREAEMTAVGVLIRQIAFFIGEDHTNDTKAGVSDIAVITRAEPRRAVLLIEVEESAGGTKPKAVIGDSLLPVLADRVDIRTEDNDHFPLSLEGARIWVGYHPRAGYDLSRTERLEAKLNALTGRGGMGGVGAPAIRLFNESSTTLYESLLTEATRLLLDLQVTDRRLGDPGLPGENAR